MKTYKTNDKFVVCIENNNHIFIPLNNENMDYQDYIAWLAEGNEPDVWNPNAEPVVEETPKESENL